MTTERDILNQIAYVREDGFAQGYSESLRMRLETILKIDSDEDAVLLNRVIACAMLDKGIATDLIEKYTGLNEQEIKQMKTQSNQQKETKQ